MKKMQLSLKDAINDGCRISFVMVGYLLLAFFGVLMMFTLSMTINVVLFNGIIDRSILNPHKILFVLSPLFFALGLIIALFDSAENKCLNTRLTYASNNLNKMVKKNKFWGNKK